MPSAFSYLPLSALFAATMAVALVAGFQFEVGEKDGWREPIRKDREMYNQWASKKRFHIGDTLRKYSLHTFYTPLLYFAIMHFFLMYVDYGFCSSDFKYQKNDSVLVVTSADYLSCNTSNPVSRFQDGSTVFRFDRSGFFYFISGQPNHCKSGQNLIIRVIHPSEAEAPEIAPSPAAAGGSDGWSSGPTPVSSTVKVSVISFFVTAPAGVFVVLYLFM